MRWYTVEIVRTTFKETRAYSYNLRCCRFKDHANGCHFNLKEEENAHTEWRFESTRPSSLLSTSSIRPKLISTSYFSTRLDKTTPTRMHGV